MHQEMCLEVFLLVSIASLTCIAQIYHYYLVSFHTAPQLSPSEVNVAVMFYGNGTPIAKVSFEVSSIITCIVDSNNFIMLLYCIQAPFICDYQTSNLSITIENVTNLPALIHLPVSTGCSRIITETFDTGLLTNHTYTLNITATAVEGVSIAAVNFSKH